MIAIAPFVVGLVVTPACLHMQPASGRHSAPVLGTWSGRQTASAEQTLEECILNADGEVEIEACMAKFDEMPSEDLDAVAVSPSLSPSSALEQCLANADGEVEAEECFAFFDELNSRVNDGELDDLNDPLSELEACMLNADGEVEIEACMDRYQPEDSLADAGADSPLAKPRPAVPQRPKSQPPAAKTSKTQRMKRLMDQVAKLGKRVNRNSRSRLTEKALSEARAQVDSKRKAVAEAQQALRVAELSLAVLVKEAELEEAKSALIEDI